jgi:PBSX family phage terminase large subunit
MNDQINATIVFDKNWQAIHARNSNGTRKYRYIINEGSSRSSKTRSLIQVFYLLGSQNKYRRYSVWRETKKDCRDTVGKDVEGIFPQLPNSSFVIYNRTESIYTFPSRSVFEINGNDEPSRLHGYNAHGIWLNEPYRFSRDSFDQLDMRAEEFIVVDWNPLLTHWIDDLKKDSRTLVIHSTFKDNPFCPEEQKMKILSYQPVNKCDIITKKILTEAEARAYDIINNPKKFTYKLILELSRCLENERKGSASAYNWSVYGLGEKAEKPNRIFFWNEISDSDYDALDVKPYYASDWGVVDPWAIIEAKYYDGALYFKEKNYLSENQIRESLGLIQRQMLKDDDESLVPWHFNQLGISKKADIICDTNRSMKIMALFNAGYDYTTGAPKPPGSIEDGINILNSLKCYYTRSSTNLKFEQENYERQLDRYGIVTETPVDLHNHCMDCCRYIALYLVIHGIIRR